MTVGGSCCKKCEQGKMMGPRYNSVRDRLVYVCSVCGFHADDVPKDHYTRKLAKDLAETYK